MEIGKKVLSVQPRFNLFNFHRASFDCFKHLKTRQYGFLVESSAVTRDMLSPFTVSELHRVARLRTADDAGAAKVVEKYLDSLPKTRRLHMRNEHSRWVTVTLDHARYLRSIGAEIKQVSHAVLFASLSDASQRLHPYRRGIQNLLEQRENFQKELAALKRLIFPTREQLRHMALLKTLAFLTKIR